MITKVPLHSFLLQFAAFQATPVERASSLTKKKWGGGVLVVEEGEQKEKGEKGLARSDNAHSQTAGLGVPTCFLHA